MRYIYFVSYGNGRERGRIEINRSKEITSIKDIEKIETMIDRGDDVVVLNYILMNVISNDEGSAI